MKKIILYLISIFLFIPNIILAVDHPYYNISDVLIDSTIMSNGDLNVEEIITLRGSFNGFERILEPKKRKNSIYDADDIVLKEVGIIEDFFSEDEFDNFTKKVTPLPNNVGEDNMYTFTEYTNQYRIKMYKETKEQSTTFYIKYTIKNAAILHNDIGELHWNYIGDDFDHIDHLSIRTKLNTKVPSDELKVWAHGPKNGEINKLEENNLAIGSISKINYLKEGKEVTVRLAFPKELISDSTKLTNKNGLNKILREEKNRAFRANTKRVLTELLDVITHILAVIVTMFNIFFIPLAIILFIYIYIKYDKEYFPSFHDEYSRNIPTSTVAEADLILNDKLSFRALNATILDLIRKGNLKLITEEDDKAIKLINTNNLSNSEAYLLDDLFKHIGDGKVITFEELNKYTENKNKQGRNNFLKIFDSWQTQAKFDYNKKLYENNDKSIKKLIGRLNEIKVAYVVINAALLIISFITRSEATISVIFSIFLFPIFNFIELYINKAKRKKKEAVNKKAELKAFKRYLKDFGRFQEKQLIEISLWKEYLVYACLFGISDEVIKEMKINLEDPALIEELDDMYIEYKIIENNINETIRRAESNDTYDAYLKEQRRQERLDSYSSSDGGGGGFSSGGGSGGGGGGGHGF